MQSCACVPGPINMASFRWIRQHPKKYGAIIAPDPPWDYAAPFTPLAPPLAVSRQSGLAVPCVVSGCHCLTLKIHSRDERQLSSPLVSDLAIATCPCDQRQRVWPFNSNSRAAQHDADVERGGQSPVELFLMRQGYLKSTDYASSRLQVVLLSPKLCWQL